MALLEVNDLRTSFRTDDGVARVPYIREARRLRAVTTIREQDVAASGAAMTVHLC